MSFSIRLSEEERKLASSYAKMHSVSMGDAFKNALFERIEDEYDISLAEQAYRAYREDGETISHEDLWERLLD